jgi:hypothetical protein
VGPVLFRERFSGKARTNSVAIGAPLSRRSLRCWLSWVAALSAVSLVATGCSGHHAAPPGAESVTVSPGRTAFLRLPDGLAITVPAGAVTRPGTLSATVGKAPAQVPAGMELAGPVYDLRLTGTSLRRDVRLTVPVPRPRQRGLAAGPRAALLVYFDSAAGHWQPVNARYNSATSVLTVLSPHLSVWSVLRIDGSYVLAAAARALRGFFGFETISPPACSNSAGLTALAVKVASDPGDLVKWCADASGGRALLRITNNRHYAIEADYPATWSMSRAGPMDPITAAILKVLPALSLKAGGPNVRTAILPGGQQIDVTPQRGSSGIVLMSPSVEGLIVDALLYGADTLAMTVGDIPGAPAATGSATAKAIAAAFDDTECLAEMDQVIQNPDVSTAEAAGGIFRSFADIALGCLADHWTSAYGIAGVEAAFITGAVLWLADGIKMELETARALIDAAVYWRGYHIYLVSGTPGSGKSPHGGHGTSPSPTPAPAPKTVTVTVTVPANAGWVDTGIHLTPSDTTHITATGSWTADGVNYTGPDGYATQSPDNYINLADLGVCAVCATTPFPEWGALMSYIGSAPPEPGSYISTSVEPQAMRVDYVGGDLHRGWTVSGELWLAMNDDAYSGNTSDNFGQVTAVITVQGP